MAADPRPGRVVRDARRRHPLACPQCQRPGRGGRSRAREGLIILMLNLTPPAGFRTFFLLPPFFAPATAGNLGYGLVQPPRPGPGQGPNFLRYLWLDAR